MLNIGLLGASGRMGSAIIEVISKKSDEYTLVGALVSSSSAHIGKKALGDVCFTADLEQVVGKSDVVLDFSNYNFTLQVIKEVLKQKKTLVCGVTGLSDECFKLLEEAKKTIKIFYSPNMSVGIGAVSEALKAVLDYINFDEFDIEISDIHHSNKKDSPSGTALFLGDVIAEKIGATREDFCLDRKSGGNIRKKGTIGFSSVRGGSVVGVHNVHFLGKDEIITVSHQALDRSVFANGALLACKKIFYS